MNQQAFIPLVTEDTVLFGLLATCLGLVFITSSSNKTFWKKFYTIVPALFMAYFLPAILTTLGVIAPEWNTLSETGEIIQHKSNLYFVASRYFLPALLY